MLILSTGEVPTETKLAEDRGRKARAGQLVRMLDIPADRGLGSGAFDHGGPDNDAGALAKAFKQAAISAYGMAGPEFVRRLIAKEVTGEDVRAMVADFTASNVPARSDGQIDRAAQRLGLIAAAGELATELGCHLGERARRAKRRPGLWRNGSIGAAARNRPRCGKPSSRFGSLSNSMAKAGSILWTISMRGLSATGQAGARAAGRIASG